MGKLSFLCLVCSFLLLTSCSDREEAADLTEQTETEQSVAREATEPVGQPAHDQTIHCVAIDDLGKPVLAREYLPYEDETVRPEMGYGIYYRKADARLTEMAVNDTDFCLEIQYDIPPLFSWGNWLSIRREFDGVLDLSECVGVALDLRVKVPSSARLRVTLSDMAALEDANKHGADEMWWFDFDRDVLATNQEWVTLRAPFQDFNLSWGEGTRQNNRRRDLSMIVAYEVNLISEGDDHPKGVVLLNSLRAYR